MHYYTCTRQSLDFAQSHALLLARDQERTDYYPRATQQCQHSPVPRRFVNLQLAVLSFQHRLAKSAHQKRSHALHQLQPDNVLIQLKTAARIACLMSALERQLRYVALFTLAVATYRPAAAPAWP